jgi:hypothetical protein
MVMIVILMHGTTNSLSSKVKTTLCLKGGLCYDTTFNFLDYMSVTCTITFVPGVSHMTATCRFLTRTPQPY